MGSYWATEYRVVGAGVVLSDVVVVGSGAGTIADGGTARVELANLGSLLFSDRALRLELPCKNVACLGA